MSAFMVSMKNLTLNVTYLTFLSSTLLPLLVAAITKLNANTRVKAYALVALSCVAGLVQTLLDKNGVVEWTSLFDNSVSAYLIAYVMHAGILKPTGATAAVANVAPNTGLGAAPVVEPEAPSAEVPFQPGAWVSFGEDKLIPTSSPTEDELAEHLGLK